MRVKPDHPACLIAAIALMATGCIPAQGRERAQPGAVPPPARPLKTTVTAEPVPAAPPVMATETPPAAIPLPPVWQTRSVVANAAEVPTSTYVVKAGDSLRKIDLLTGAASEAIARENGLLTPFKIKTGQKLRIPGGRYHRVAKYESGIAIARAYGVDWQRVATLNHLEEPYILREGQRLLLPSRAEVSTMTPDERAAAFRVDIEDLITGSEPAVASSAPVNQPATAPRPTAPAMPTPPTTALGEPDRFNGRFDWPVKGRVIRSFGNYASGQKNDGINIAANRGDPIVAAADGIIAYAGSDIAVYGTLALIRHGDGWISAYGYADSLIVTRGQRVKAGQVIGYTGASPYSGEPQLHFEIRNGRKPVDPAAYLPRRS